MRALTALLALIVVVSSGCGLVLDNSPADSNLTGDGGSGRIPCTVDDVCNDHNPCNGLESCASDGFCIAGTYVQCPGHGCVAGVCNPQNGECFELPNPAACDDTIECSHDVCNADGTCSHEAKNDLCDDGFACTEDLCVLAGTAGSATGCVSTRRDSLCAQPNVGSPCASFVCMPYASSDETGCVLAPTRDFCASGERCNLATFVCEVLPDSCTGCDDGNPCNGVETCDTSSGSPVCSSTQMCPDVPPTCAVTICDTRSGDPTCGMVDSNDPLCTTP